MKWLKSLLRCCRQGRPRVVHVLAADGQDQDSGFRRPHRRTYYYSIFVARLAIMIMLAILIALLTILTWHFTTVYTTRSIKNLAFSLRVELLNRPIARMWNLLNSTVETTLSQVHLSEFVVGQYSLPIDTATQIQVHKTMRNVTWAIFASRNTAKSITVAYRNGQLQAFDRDVATNKTYYVFSEPGNGTVLGAGGLNSPTSAPALAPDSALAPVSTWPDGPPGSSNISWFSETVDMRTGVPTSPPIITPAYDLSKEIEDVLLLKDGDVSWHVTVSDFEETPLLSSASAVRHPATGTVLAATGITTALSSINAFLRELTVAHSGYLYLTTADGYLLASSTNASLIDTSGPKRRLILANESSDPVIKAGAQWLYEKYGSDGLLKQVVHAEDILLEGNRFYIDSFSLQLPRLQMVGVIIIPRTYVMGAVDRRGRATLAILIAISSCILLVGCIFILILTSGVSNEMKLRAELIDHLDARRRAEASSNYKSQFLANMSHELRTPMAAVIGLLDILLCDDCLSTEQVNMVSQIRRCSTALLRLLNNILDISKVESGKLLLEEADFDLCRELEGLVDMFSVQCVDHEIEIVLDLADDMPRMVRGDSARTVQIFANLIANSVKFTSSGHVILRGWCGSTNAPASSLRNGLLFGKEDNAWNNHRPGHDLAGPSSLEPGKMLMWFEVEDTGCGIDPSKWEAVFDSFVQADPSTTRTYGGTGLGLCIVRSLVRKMSGDIKVVNKQGPGTLLRFYLVFGQPSETEPDTPRLSVPSELENAKVLLALKGDVGRGTLAQWMHFRGLQVYEASEWDETIQTLQGLLDKEHRTGWNSCSGQNVYMVPEANYIKADHTFLNGQDNNGVPEDEVSLVLSGNPAQWKMQNFKVLVVLDSEVLPWDESLQMESMLSVLDEFREQGVMISWLLNHDTPNTLKTQLRRTGYSITVNQPLYKSKLLQLLTAMAGCLERGSSQNMTSDLQALQFIDNGGPKSVFFEEGKAAAIDIHELEKLQSQVQNKLAMTGANKSLPKVLERWSSQKDLANLEKNHSRTGQTGIALDIISIHQDPEQHPVNRKSLDRSMSFSNRRSDLHRGPVLTQRGEEEQEMSNLGPSASPVSSGAASPRSLSGWLTPSPVSVITDLPSPMLSVNISQENGPINHVVDMPPVLPDPVSDPLLIPSVSNPEDASKAGPFHDVSNKPMPPVATGDVDKIKTPQSTEPTADRIPSADSKDLPCGPAPPDTLNSTESAGSSQESAAYSPSTVPASRPPARTRNSTAKKSPSSRLGPSDALFGIRILLAEDTPVLQRVATIMLEKMGARVVAVGDGLQAVETIGRSRGAESLEGITPQMKVGDGSVDKFDLVLMDCQMPRMDGYDATRAIRKAEEGRDWHIPIVALTAHAMSSDEAKCLQVGMDAYLTKPIDCKLMVSTILSLTKKGG